MVETPIGVGLVREIRHQCGDTFVLVQLMPGGFGRGYCDVFLLEEVARVE